MMPWGDRLALLNAILNGSSALCLLFGLVAIKKRRVEIHRFLMGSAFGISTLFLISYVTRFYLTGVHRYEGVGFSRTLYLTILTTHTTLAALVPFLAMRTLYLALRNRFETHKKIARITWPIWMYVSITGVVVYSMLYHARG